MAFSKTALLFGLLFAVTLLISSEVFARELAENDSGVKDYPDGYHGGHHCHHGHCHGHGDMASEDNKKEYHPEGYHHGGHYCHHGHCHGHGHDMASQDSKEEYHPEGYHHGGHHCHHGHCGHGDDLVSNNN